jgi:serine/threonine protein phosphatase 1
MYLRFQENTAGRDLCVGDVHGCFTRLAAFLKALNFNETVDRLFSVGDLCDRGPDSADVSDWLRKSWFHPAAGNHERMLVNAYEDKIGGHEELLFINGGAWYFGLTPEEKADIYHGFISLPYMIEVCCAGKNYGIIHSDVLGNDWNYTREQLYYDESKVSDHILWDRGRWMHGLDKYQDVKGVDWLLVGHTPMPSAFIENNVINLDSGGVFKGKYAEHSDGLTIFNMTDFEFYKEADYV